MSASRALRAGTRSPRAAQAPPRNTATCHTLVTAPMRLDSTAVDEYPPTASARRRAGSSDIAPPASLAVPARASATPSMAPRIAADAPRELRRLGSNAVGTSWPTSARKLAAPMPTTPADSQGCWSFGTGGLSSATAEWVRSTCSDGCGGPSAGGVGVGSAIGQQGVQGALAVRLGRQGVDPRRIKAGVAHQLGHGHEVHPAAHEPGPKRVSEHVWPERIGALGVEVGEPPQPFDDLSGIAVTDPPSPCVEPQGRRGFGARSVSGSPIGPAKMAGWLRPTACPDTSQAGAPAALVHAVDRIVSFHGPPPQRQRCALVFSGVHLRLAGS